MEHLACRSRRGSGWSVAAFAFVLVMVALGALIQGSIGFGLCCGAGHSSIVQTMDTYSHLVPGMADDAAERFGGYLFGSD